MSGGPRYIRERPWRPRRHRVRMRCERDHTWHCIYREDDGTDVLIQGDDRCPECGREGERECEVYDEEC